MNKIIHRLLLIILATITLVACDKGNQFPDYSNGDWIYIPGGNLTVKTGVDNWIQINPQFGNETLKQKSYTWEIQDPTLAKLEPSENNSVVVTGLKEGATLLKLQSTDGQNLVYANIKVEKGYTVTEPVFIDFGMTASSAPFNSLTDPKFDGAAPLKDIKDAETGYTIQIENSEKFKSLDRGIRNNLGFPIEVSRDMFFNDGIKVSQSSLRIKGFNPRLKYTFILYGAINDNSYVETQYTLKGAETGKRVLNVGGSNPDRTVSFEEVSPDNNGDFLLSLTYGPKNNQWAKFYCISAMIILPQGYQQ